MSPTPSRPMAAQGTGEALLEGEVAKLHGLLSLQSCPIKDVTLKAGPVPSSSKALLHVEVQSAAYDRDSRTLRIQVYPEVDPSAKSYMQLLLALPLQLELFFPESLSDPPLLFGSTDGAALISERVSILPLDRSSLMHALSVIISTIKSEVDSIWPPLADWRPAFASETLTRLRSCPRSADLLLSLLSMSKGHHPTIRFPIPRFFYQDGGAIDQQAVLSAIAHVPAIHSLLDGTGAVEALPFQSCVLLNHLLSRLRVSLSDVTGGMEQDPLLSRCFCCPRGASTVERPELAFKVSAVEDMRFSELAAKHGTRIGFHGSPPENFFSIVALGLKNLSGTKGMRNGAAFGEGSYLAADLNVARQFGGWGRQVWRNSSFGAMVNGRPPQFAYQLIALCEFIDLPQYRKTMSNKEGSAYYVIAEDHHLTVRALLLFKDPALKAPSSNPSGTSTTAARATRVAPPPPPRAPGVAVRRDGHRLGDSSVAVLACLAFIIGFGLWLTQGRLRFSVL